MSEEKWRCIVCGIEGEDSGPSEYGVSIGRGTWERTPADEGEHYVFRDGTAATYCGAIHDMETLQAARVLHGPAIVQRKELPEYRAAVGPCASTSERGVR